MSQQHQGRTVFTQCGSCGRTCGVAIVGGVMVLIESEPCTRLAEAGDDREGLAYLIHDCQRSRKPIIMKHKVY